MLYNVFGTCSAPLEEAVAGFPRCCARCSALGSCCSAGAACAETLPKPGRARAPFPPGALLFPPKLVRRVPVPVPPSPPLTCARGGASQKLLFSGSRPPRPSPVLPSRQRARSQRPPRPRRRPETRGDLAAMFKGAGKGSPSRSSPSRASPVKPSK